MTHAQIAEARRFMTGEPSSLEFGGEICTSCGRQTATEKYAKAFSSTFNQTAFYLYDSSYVCGRCLSLFKDKAVRSKCLLWMAPGKRTVLEREEILPLLKRPPQKFVLCLPYSFQKHTFFYAGLSNDKTAIIGTDNRAVIVDYQKNDIPAIIDQIVGMLKEGIPRKELETGHYSIFTRSRYGSILETWENILAPMRLYGAIELFVRYSPAVRDKIKPDYEVEEMFSESEKTAIRLLLALADASNVRRNRPLDFWGHEFRRRLARFQEEKDLHVFFSRTAEQLQCGSGLDISILEDLEETEYPDIMKDIRTKLDILVAAAYTAHKEKREIKETPKPMQRRK